MGGCRRIVRFRDDEFVVRVWMLNATRYEATVVTDTTTRYSTRDREAVLMRFFSDGLARSVRAGRSTKTPHGTGSIAPSKNCRFCFKRATGRHFNRRSRAGLLPPKRSLPRPSGLAKAVTGVAIASSGGATATTFSYSFYEHQGIHHGGRQFLFLVRLHRGSRSKGSRRRHRRLAAANQGDGNSRNRGSSCGNGANPADESARIPKIVGECPAAMASAPQLSRQDQDAPDQSKPEPPNRAMDRGDKFLAEHPARQLWDEREKMQLPKNGTAVPPLGADSRIRSTRSRISSCNQRRTSISVPPRLITLLPSRNDAGRIRKVRAQALLARAVGEAREFCDWLRL